MWRFNVQIVQLLLSEPNWTNSINKPLCSVRNLTKWKMAQQKFTYLSWGLLECMKLPVVIQAAQWNDCFGNIHSWHFSVFEKWLMSLDEEIKKFSGAVSLLELAITIKIYNYTTHWCFSSGQPAVNFRNYHRRGVIRVIWSYAQIRKFKSFQHKVNFC